MSTINETILHVLFSEKKSRTSDMWSSQMLRELVSHLVCYRLGVDIHKSISAPLKDFLVALYICRKHHAIVFMTFHLGERQ